MPYLMWGIFYWTQLGGPWRQKGSEPLEYSTYVLHLKTTYIDYNQTRNKHNVECIYECHV